MKYRNIVDIATFYIKIKVYQNDSNIYECLRICAEATRKYIKTHEKIYKTNKLTKIFVKISGMNLAVIYMCK